MPKNYRDKKQTYRSQSIKTEATVQLQNYYVERDVTVAFHFSQYLQALDKEASLRWTANKEQAKVKNH